MKYPHPRDWQLDRVLLIVSYVLLVAVVIFEAWWINKEFNESKDERCALAYLEVEVTRLHGNVGDLPPANVASLNESLDAVEAVIYDYCGDLFVSAGSED